MIRRARRGATAAVGAACMLMVAFPASVSAQSGEVSASECCRSLQYTIGGRAQSLGEAITARIAASSVFANPALLAGVLDDQIIIHNAETEIEKSNTFSLVIHSDVAGVFGFSFRFLDFGTQQKTTIDGIPVGSFRDLTWVATASYATDVFGGLDAGVNYKMYQERRDCSGFCDDVTDAAATTHGIDLGLRYAPPRLPSLVVGASLVDLGFALQAVNAEQASPMPLRLRLGAAWEVGHHFISDSTVAVWTSADIVTRPRDGKTYVNAGLDVSFDELVFVRAGYSGSGQFNGGVAAGVGVHWDRFVVDIAKSFRTTLLDDEPIQISFAIKF